MSGRLRGIAGVNAQIIAEGEYTTDDGTVVVVGPALEAAISGTVSHPPDERIDLPHTVTAHRTSFEVTAESSLQAARRLHVAKAERIAVLNFASARNPGGGYLGGAKAQEEDLCRNALLYPCLLQAPDYYAAHRASPDLLYSHRVIWSPDVPVHRDDNGRLLADPYRVSLLTSPAPNAGEALRRDPNARNAIQRALYQRAERVLAVAAHHGARQLVLGAWGCGVFRNDPREVADAFHTHLTGAFSTVFERVVFAVWDRSPESTNRAAFADRFTSWSSSSR
ncbi:TIGR02452 family protein [Acrocarpospora pleiomorpha]|uniref:TIGR02452 family protein n=1 Tax=Acrocarpospora pleiomorpha TaxID=90975 RepID=A0A5M3XT37_9ACTN|nr:TIGR02452 family protein [Acrocarpospora pleiomorpha]GES24000.1 TIGR02452 family protein [Acrocarpospora pleiomorpha]